MKPPMHIGKQHVPMRQAKLEELAGMIKRVRQPGTALQCIPEQPAARKLSFQKSNEQNMEICPAALTAEPSLQHLEVSPFHVDMSRMHFQDLCRQTVNQISHDTCQRFPLTEGLIRYLASIGGDSMAHSSYNVQALVRLVRGLII